MQFGVWRWLWDRTGPHIPFPNTAQRAKLASSLGLRIDTAMNDKFPKADTASSATSPWAIPSVQKVEVPAGAPQTRHQDTSLPGPIVRGSGFFVLKYDQPSFCIGGISQCGQHHALRDPTADLDYDRHALELKLQSKGQKTDGRITKGTLNLHKDNGPTNYSLGNFSPIFLSDPSSFPSTGWSISTNQQLHNRNTAATQPRHGNYHQTGYQRPSVP